MKKLLTLTIFTILLSTGFAQTCDTLFNLQSVLDTPIVYYADTTSTQGYISGNNEYGDLAKAEGFGALIGDSIYSAVLYFAVDAYAPQDSNSTVLICVWDNTGISGYSTAGAPGNVIDTVSVTLKQIALAMQYSGPLQVTFAQPAAITTDTIYVGVILPTTGDTLALYTNEVPYGPDGNGWEYEGSPYYAWGSYNNDWEFTQGSLGNYIAAEMCGNAVASGISTITNNAAIKIFPNPANDQLNLELNLDDAAEVTMYDLTGSPVKSFTVRGTALNTFDIHDLAAGSYIIRTTDKQTNQQLSSLFIKL